MSFRPPSAVVPTADERELLLRFLHAQREVVVQTASGLTEEQVRWTPGGRLLPIIGVINHLAHVEERWIDGRFLQRDVFVEEEEFVVGPDRSLAAVISAYWDRGHRTDEIVREAAGLHLPCLGGRGQPPVPAHVLLGFDEPVDLRWSILHLIEETAHHAGHADSTREMLDGAQMR